MNGEYDGGRSLAKERRRQRGAVIALLILIGICGGAFVSSNQTSRQVDPLVQVESLKERMNGEERECAKKLVKQCAEDSKLLPIAEDGKMVTVGKKGKESKEMPLRSDYLENLDCKEAKTVASRNKKAGTMVLTFGGGLSTADVDVPSCRVKKLRRSVMDDGAALVPLIYCLVTGCGSSGGGGGGGSTTVLEARWTELTGPKKYLSSVAISAGGTMYGTETNGAILVRAAFNSAQWSVIHGGLKHISVSNDGLAVVGTQYTVAGAAHDVYLLNGVTSSDIDGSGTWSAIKNPNARIMKVVSAGKTYLYGVDDNNDIWRRARSGGSWSLVDGKLQQISAHGDNVVGVNRDGHIYKLNADGKTWTLYPGKGTWASMGSDGDFWVIGMDGKTIYHWDGSAWQQMAGNMKQIDVATKNKVTGIALNGTPYTLEFRHGL